MLEPARSGPGAIGLLPFYGLAELDQAGYRLTDVPTEDWQMVGTAAASHVPTLFLSGDDPTDRAQHYGEKCTCVAQEA